jgi:hypothetical protein
MNDGAPMSEWLKLVLAEVDRKREERKAARHEQDRRAKAAQGTEAREPRNRSDPA